MTANTPASWTRWYWPSAVGICAAALAFVPDSWEQAALIATALALLIPEGIALGLRRAQDTLSYWVWGVLDVVRNQPLRDWTAKHFLALGGYLILLGRVLFYLWNHHSPLAAVTTVVAVWLLFHLFGQWWTGRAPTPPSASLWSTTARTACDGRGWTRRPSAAATA